jgi:hypothetical protein
MVISCWICAVSLLLSAFISILTPIPSVVSLNTDAVTELILSSIELCFELKLSHSRSISTRHCRTVDRLDISPYATAECPPGHGFWLLVTVIIVLSSSIVRSNSIPELSLKTSFYDSTKGAFLPYAPCYS